MPSGASEHRDVPEQRAAYAEVFAIGEFRTLWIAQLASVAGDQIARVALTVLVFDRTKSAGLAALTYALTFLPDLVGGPLLSGLADRYPRRRVMVLCDWVVPAWLRRWRRLGCRCGRLPRCLSWCSS